ncbi:MAG: lysophospholipid acyltransferase family protein [Candidatus Eisenbacteria bacterium]|nr:lysophospholipid acyltransferase family protein [Candidatus Eisenbacteria bacterium]
MKGIGNEILFRLAIGLGPLLIRLLGRTWRITFHGVPEEEVLRIAGGPVIHSFWHGRLLALVYTHRNRGIRILISRHRDGEIITRITERLGFRSVRGSTGPGKGGVRAILEMAKRGRAGDDLAITPDGPRGPREKAQAGIVLIAQRSGVPILPMSTAADRGRFLRSWDLFLVPAPFARVAVVLGEPIRVPPELSPEESEAYRVRIEEALTRVREEADRVCGKSK